MPKPDWKDDGRRCTACGGTSRTEPLVRYRAVWDEVIPRRPAVFHPTCVGAYLLGNPSCTLQFAPGIVETEKPITVAGLEL